jgi:hypothetical protein
VYVERPSRLPGAVVWSTRAGSTSAIVPDGCMDVICYGDRLLVAGPDTRPHTESPGELAAGTPVVGVRFAPGIGPTVLGVPAAELRDRRVWLDEVLGERRDQSVEASCRPVRPAGPRARGAGRQPTGR